MSHKEHLAILASGSGSNAANFMRYFQDHPTVEISLIITSNAAAGVLEKADAFGVDARYLPADSWEDRDAVLALFERYRITAVVLAGYLRLVPDWLIRRYSGRIFNIHPALLPFFGGKGMYGIHVHRAVIRSGAKRTGITIHLVNERYDEGPILFQESIPVYPDDTPERLAERVQRLEHNHYPVVVEEYLLNPDQEIQSKK